MTPDLERAAVRTPVAPLFAEPNVGSAQISQLLAGKPLEVLDSRDDWYLVRGPDEYEGWLHRGYIAPAPDGDSRRSSGVERLSLGCITTDGRGGRRAMPLGAMLAPEERVSSGEAIDAASQPARFPTDAQAITRTAQLYFEGTSYLWGGVTPWGADCSGLAQAVFALHGVQLRRDAWQQAEQGAAGEPELLASRTADLLFFSDRVDGHVTHVGIALGQRRMVHLALGRGGYGVERLDDDRDPYVARLRDRFRFARRMLAPHVLRDGG